MKPKLSEWASGAEIAASIAVVITLILVISSMRENTNAIQANTYQELMRDINQWRSSIRESGLPFTNEQIGLALETWSSDDLTGIRLADLELWGIYEAAFFANERGVLGDNEWIRFERMICFERDSAEALQYWSNSLAGILPLSMVLTPAFVEYVDSLCE